MFHLPVFFCFFLIELPISSISIYFYSNAFTVIGEKNVTRRSSIITQSFSKLSINGPFNCHVTWVDNKQTIDIYTDDNIHPYVTVNMESETLKIIIHFDGNFKFTEMNIHLNLHPTIKDIVLAGISTLYSVNVLNINNLLKLHTEGMKINKSSIHQFCNIVLGTSSLILQLNVPNLDALFLSAGTTNLIGHVKDKAIIKYNGIGDVDASQLFCKRVNIASNGLGTVWITGVDECIMKAEGVSIVRYNYSHINHTQLTGLAKINSM
jgi:hypothetical protein